MHRLCIKWGAVGLFVAALAARCWGQNFPTIGSTTGPGGPFNGNGRGLTNVLATPGLTWNAQLTPLLGVSTFVAGISGAQQALGSYAAPVYADAWVTNVCTALTTNGMWNVGWSNILFEDVGTNGTGVFSTANTNGLWYRAPSGVLLTNGCPGANWVQNMLSFAHNRTNRFNVLGYLQTCKTSELATGAGNPMTSLAHIYGDVTTLLYLGFDGVVLDFNGNDIDVESVRQGNRLVDQAIADFYAAAVDGTATNRLQFTVIRSLAPGSTSPAAVVFPAETIWEVNGLSVPGLYNISTLDWRYFTNISYFGSLNMTYAWAVGPGHWLAPTSWNSYSLNSAPTNQNIMNMYAMCAAALQVGRGWGEDTTVGTEIAASQALFTNSPEYFAIVQDPAVIMGTTVWSNAATATCLRARKLGGASSLTNAVLFVNNDTVSHTMTLTNWSIGGTNKSLYAVRDPWGAVTWSNYCDQLVLTVGATNSVLVKVWPSDFNPTKVTSCQCIGWWDFANPNLAKGSNIFFLKDLANGVGPMFADQGHEGANAYGAYQTNSAGIYWGKNFGYMPAQITNGFTTGGTAIISQPNCYLFVGCAPNATAQTLMEGAASSTRQDFFFNSATTMAMYAGVQLNSATIVVNKDYIYQAEFNGTTSALYTNGILNVSGSAGTNPQQLPMYWGINNSGSQNAQADTAVVLMFRGFWSAFDKVSLEAWANSNYNVH